MKRIVYGSLSVLTAIGTVFVAANAEVIGGRDTEPKATSETAVTTKSRETTPALPDSLSSSAVTTFGEQTLNVEAADETASSGLFGAAKGSPMLTKGVLSEQPTQLSNQPTGVRSSGLLQQQTSPVQISQVLTSPTPAVKPSATDTTAATDPAVIPESAGEALPEPTTEVSPSVDEPTLTGPSFSAPGSRGPIMQLETDTGESVAPASGATPTKPSEEETALEETSLEESALEETSLEGATGAEMPTDVVEDDSMMQGDTFPEEETFESEPPTGFEAETSDEEMSEEETSEEGVTDDADPFVEEGFVEEGMESEGIEPELESDGMESDGMESDGMESDGTEPGMEPEKELEGDTDLESDPFTAPSPAPSSPVPSDDFSPETPGTTDPEATPDDFSPNGVTPVNPSEDELDQTLPATPLPPSPVTPAPGSTEEPGDPIEGDAFDAPAPLGNESDRLIGEGFTPFQLSYLAIGGGLEEAGIPGGNQLMSAYEDGEISAEDIVAAGAVTKRLGTAASDESEYAKGVDKFLKLFNRDGLTS
ncbi:MAG: hypothetical protein ACFB16_11980 [Phormidesmis sp.]